MSKHVVISGAASGLGKGLAKQYFKNGYYLHLWDRNSESLQEIKSQFSERVFVYAFDLTNDNDLDLAVQETLKNANRKVDLVIANAGVGGVNPGNSFSREINRKIFEVNSLGAINTLMAFVPNMIETKSGQLVAISSLASLRGLPAGASYSASKGALNNFLESVAMDLKPQGIDCTLILPGFIKTPMIDHDEFPTPFTLSVEDAAKRCFTARWHRWLLPKLNPDVPSTAQIF